MKKKNYPPRVPGINCPHCNTRAKAYDSVEIDRLTREIRFRCDDVECGHVFLAQLAIVRTVRSSLKPNPAVTLHVGPWGDRAANDDTRIPANDDRPAAAEIAPHPG
ncbi:ogr/Delta-like zinc finger family protein [Sphingomonadaceae bacterium OTU29THOMA1]|nr:ogr/Delta-like zinc finger family protein [Sphingomonadaceae bacterium OTU29THOMA1]